MFEKRNLIEAEGKDLLQNPIKKIGLSVHGGNVRKDIKEENYCVTESWMNEVLNDSVKKILVTNGILIVKLEDDKGADNYDKQNG